MSSNLPSTMAGHGDLRGLRGLPSSDVETVPFTASELRARRNQEKLSFAQKQFGDTTIPLTDSELAQRAGKAAGDSLPNVKHGVKPQEVTRINQRYADGLDRSTLRPRAAPFPESQLLIKTHKEAKSSQHRSRRPSSHSSVSVERMNKEFELLRLQKMPRARIVFSLAFELSQGSMSSEIVRLDEKINDKRVVGVLQRTHDVDFEFSMPLSLESSAQERPRRVEGPKFSCQILYDPTSDNCFIICKSMRMILVEMLSQHHSQVDVGKGASIAPGLWRLYGISIGKPIEEKSHMCDLLLVRRQFHVSVRKERGKRRATDEVASSDAKKLKRIEDLTEVVFSPIPRDENAGQHQTTSGVAKGAQLSASIIEDEVLLTDLNVGETAWIETEYSISPSAPGNKDNDSSGSNYQLSRLAMVGQTEATAVFACRHSAILSDNIVAKVLRYSGSGKGLKNLVNSWKREKKVLERLDHPNIMSMKGFDGRLFAIFLEHLPSHLRNNGADYTKQDFNIILHDSASGLAYLASKSLAHNDIKPMNITFSRERGAVIIDLGLVSPSMEQSSGGTPHFVPPEYLDDIVRGNPGDVWALGITMLLIMGKLSSKHSIPKRWSIFDAAQPGNDRKTMRNWLDLIGEQRNKLNREDLMEATVYDMLDKSPQTRITAKEIVARLSPPS